MTPTQAAAASLVVDLRRVFGDRLQSVVAYGAALDGNTDAPLTCLALVQGLTVSDLEGCAARAPHWERAGVATPLILPEEEFRRSLDAFPLEFGEIIRAHARVFGDDPFSGLVIARDDLRRACETQVKSHLLHLREGFIESGGRPASVARLVAASAPAFTALLRNVARLNDVSTGDHMDITRAGARATGVPDGLVSDLLALERPSGVPATDAARLFPGYLAAVEQLAHAVDTWRA
jgi:hypothetical protein